MWWENAVIYQVYIRSFQDSDGDGIGDLPGVTSRLDHIAWLGADAVWLSPIYRSPNDDFGYDVSDFLSVDPALGTLEDFDELTRAAHARTTTCGPTRRSTTGARRSAARPGSATPSPAATTCIRSIPSRRTSTGA